MVLSNHRGGYARGGYGDNRDLHRSLLEHNLPIYRDSSGIGAVSGGVAVSGVTDTKVVVGKGGSGMGESTVVKFGIRYGERDGDRD